STTRCASVPSQTDAAMNSTSAAIAPTPGDGIAGDWLATDWATSSNVSGMISLRRPIHKLLFRLLVSQLLIRDDIPRQHEAQQRACHPRHNDSPEHPVGKTEHIRQRRCIAPVAKAIADADRIDARG